MRAIEKIQKEGHIEADNRARYQCKRCNRFVLHLEDHYNTQICRRGDECRKLILSGWFPSGGLIGSQNGTARALLVRQLGVETRTSNELQKNTGYRSWYPTYAILAMLTNHIRTSVKPKEGYKNGTLVGNWEDSVRQCKMDIAQGKADPSYALMLYAELKASKANVLSWYLEPVLQAWFEKEDKKHGHKYSQVRDV